MLTIMPEAIKFIKDQMKKANDGDLFRLSIKRTGCSGWMYVPDIISEPKETDIFEGTVNDLKIYIDSESKKFLENTIVDLEVKELGFKQLVFKNSKATGVCGCGESFLIEENKDE